MCYNVYRKHDYAGGRYMFPNLNIELAKMGYSKTKLAKAVNIPVSTLCEKLNGNNPILLKECKAIRNVINKQYSIDYLFETKEEEEI